MQRFFLSVGTVSLLLVSAAAVASSSPVVALERLSEDAIAQQTATLPGWRVEDQQLVCTYQFSNFVESIDFVNRLVAPAEAAGHHPDLVISYSQVTLSLTTHDAGGLTQMDFDLAQTLADLSDRPCVPVTD